MTLLSPSKSIPFSWKKILQIRNNLGHGGTDDQHHPKSRPKCTMCFISFLPLTCPLRAASSLTLLSAYTSSSFFSKCPSSPYFLEQLKPDFLHLAQLCYKMKHKHFIWGKKKKASLPLVTQTKERLEEGVDQAQSREGKVLSSDWPRDLVSRDEWRAGNLPSSPRTWQEHGKLCHLLKEAWWGLQAFTKQLQGLRAPPIGLDAKCIST